MTYKLLNMTNMTIKVNMKYIEGTPKKSKKITNFVMAGGASG
ncbi:hypothetical protein [Virgibacillus necropolis]|nr:hypothetical protein [Virgibacillus necropolis]